MATELIDATGDLRPIRMVQGNSFSLETTVFNEVGNPVNLADFTLRYQVRKTLAGAAVINGTQANGRLVVTNASGGVFKMIVNPSDTANILFASAEDDELEMFYDVELTRTSDGLVTKPIRGTFTILREITR